MTDRQTRLSGRHRLLDKLYCTKTNLELVLVN